MAAGRRNLETARGVCIGAARRGRLTDCPDRCRRTRCRIRFGWCERAKGHVGMERCQASTRMVVLGGAGVGNSSAEQLRARLRPARKGAVRRNPRHTHAFGDRSARHCLPAQEDRSASPLQATCVTITAFPPQCCAADRTAGRGRHYYLRARAGLASAGLSPSRRARRTEAHEPSAVIAL